MEVQEEQIEKIEDIYCRLRDVTDGLPLSNKKLKFKQIKNCFCGFELVDWLVSNVKVHKIIAEQIGQNLLDQLIIHRIPDGEDFLGITASAATTNSADDLLKFCNDNSLYRFQEDEDNRMLNCKRIFSGYIKTASDLLKEIFDAAYKIIECYILKPNISGGDGGETIDYEKIQQSKEFRKFENLTIELQMIQPSGFNNDREILAFFINVYKLLLFHANIKCQRPKIRNDLFLRCNYRTQTKPNRSVALTSSFGYLIGGQKYSLAEIEHGILRANRKPHVFGRNDPRRSLVPSSIFDPRIHFLLVNSTTEESGFNPLEPLKMISVSSMYNDMQKATEQFCASNEVKVHVSRRLVTLSWIFHAYTNDFGKDRIDVLRWIVGFINDEQKKRDIGNLLENNPQLTRILYEDEESFDTIYSSPPPPSTTNTANLSTGNNSNEGTGGGIEGLHKQLQRNGAEDDTTGNDNDNDGIVLPDITDFTNLTRSASNSNFNSQLTTPTSTRPPSDELSHEEIENLVDIEKQPQPQEVPVESSVSSLANLQSTTSELSSPIDTISNSRSNSIGANKVARWDTDTDKPMETNRGGSDTKDMKTTEKKQSKVAAFGMNIAFWKNRKQAKRSPNSVTDDNETS